MATNPPPPAPEPPHTPAQMPGPNASREEWRAWRRQRWSQGGWYGGPWFWFGSGWFWGGALVVLGLYFLLSNLGLLWWLRGDVFWPIVLILFGVFLIARRGRWWP